MENSTHPGGLYSTGKVCVVLQAAQNIHRWYPKETTLLRLTTMPPQLSILTHCYYTFGVPSRNNDDDDVSNNNNHNNTKLLSVRRNRLWSRSPRTAYMVHRRRDHV